MTRWERVVDERDIIQAVSEMETIWREQMIKGYRNDPVYQLVQDSSNTSRGGKMQHYRIGNSLLYATTRGGEDCLSIPKEHGINGETLRELMISEIQNKGHHSAIGIFGMHQNISTGRRCGRTLGILSGNVINARPIRNATPCQMVMFKLFPAPPRYFQVMLLISWEILPN